MDCNADLFAKNCKRFSSPSRTIIVRSFYDYLNASIIISLNIHFQSASFSWRMPSNCFVYLLIMLHVINHNPLKSSTIWSFRIGFMRWDDHWFWHSDRGAGIVFNEQIFALKNHFANKFSADIGVREYFSIFLVLIEKRLGFQTMFIWKSYTQKSTKKFEFPPISYKAKICSLTTLGIGFWPWLSP